MNYEDECKDPDSNHDCDRPDHAGFASAAQSPYPPKGDGLVAPASRPREVEEAVTSLGRTSSPAAERPNPNLHSTVSEALGCYPSAMTFAFAIVPTVVPLILPQHR